MGGALIVAPVYAGNVGFDVGEAITKHVNFGQAHRTIHKPEQIGLKSAPTIDAPGEETGTALGNRGLEGFACACMTAKCGGNICILQQKLV